MSEQQEKSLVVHRLKFLALIAIFIVPFIAAWVALYVFDYRPGSKNYGNLVQPVRPLEFPALTARGDRQLDADFWSKWTFVILDKGDCVKLCRDNLYYLRQMRVALGRDVNRVQNLLIMQQTINHDLASFITDYPDLTVIEYVVDGANRRVGKKIDGVFVQRFLYRDQLNPVAELDGAGNVISRFVYAEKGNVPAHMERAGTSYRIVSDHAGSVRLVVDSGTGDVILEFIKRIADRQFGGNFCNRKTRGLRRQS